MADSKKQGDLIDRNSKKSAPLGTTTFVGLRALDPYLQYQILNGNLASSVVSMFGSSVLAQGPTSNTGYAFLDNLQLSPYRLALLGMAVGASAKHVFWKLFIGQEEMGAAPAAAVGVLNSTFNSINTLLFVCSATSIAAGRGEGPNWSGWPGAPLALGSALFATGILTETVAEVQRALFKRKEENKGKAYKGGLWSTSRHVNYFGYTLWRTGFALAGGGWICAVMTGGLFSYDFLTRAIPSLDEYCEQRYADMWRDYRKQTPYKFVPYLY